MRYKVWRSNKDKELHLLCAEGADAFEALPTAIRKFGPWTGSKEGDVVAPEVVLAMRCARVDKVEMKWRLKAGGKPRRR